MNSLPKRILVGATRNTKLYKAQYVSAAENKQRYKKLGRFKRKALMIFKKPVVTKELSRRCLIKTEIWGYKGHWSHRDKRNCRTDRKTKEEEGEAHGSSNKRDEHRRKSHWGRPGGPKKGQERVTSLRSSPETASQDVVIEPQHLIHFQESDLVKVVLIRKKGWKPYHGDFSKE